MLGNNLLSGRNRELISESMNIASSSSSIPLKDSAASSNGSPSEDDEDVDEDEVDDDGIGESLVSISTTDYLFLKKSIKDLIFN